MPRRPPASTYRLQLSDRFGFDAARRLVPYLARLGVDVLYVSPVFAARPGSSHGYDGIDPTRIDPGRGGSVAFARLLRALDARRMGLLLDLVPNHLATALENAAWYDVLRRGPRSPHARSFDIDWHRTEDGRPAVVLPWLGEEARAAFARGTLAFGWEHDRLCLRHGAATLPGSPRSTRLLERWLREEGSTGLQGGGARRTVSARSLLRRLNGGRTATDRDRRARLLGALWYRLVPWWETTAVNYRRFFDISDLVGLRTDDRRTFAWVHRGMLRAARSPAFAGVRVDHIDGLLDPLGYLKRLARVLPRPGGRRGTGPAYLLVEKILAPDEELPAAWPVDGTTGYEVLQRITGVLLSRTSLRPLSAAYRRVCHPRAGSFAEEAYRAKRDVARTLFPGERAELLGRLVGDAPLPGSRADRLDRALVAVTAALRVYRTYGRDGRLLTEDRHRLRQAFEDARRREPALDRAGGFRDLARRWVGASRPPARLPCPARFLERWQQWSGAVMAKGVEDTAFYRYPRFLALNEVGGDPDRFGTPLREFHTFLQRRARRSPHGLTTTSTHDTKWGEDARARLVALSERAAEWGRSVLRWERDPGGLLGPAHRRHGPTAPDRYRLYQALVASAPVGGVFPKDYRQRIETYVVKAAREAKQTTSWLRPDAAHEEALREHVRRLLVGPRAARFRAELDAWVRWTSFFGGYYSLAQTVLRSTVPGVPDLYQGSEGWNHALVDPDNRRPVPFGRLARLLAASGGDRPGDGFLRRSSSLREGGPTEGDKITLTAGLLRFRRAHCALFERGSYLPVYERRGYSGPAVVTFARQLRTDWLLVVVGRGLARVSGGRPVPPLGALWRDRSISLPRGAPGTWKELVSGRDLRWDRGDGSRRAPLAEIFDHWPVAVLYHAATSPGRPAS